MGSTVGVAWRSWGSVVVAGLAYGGGMVTKTHFGRGEGGLPWMVEGDWRVAGVRESR